MTLVKVLRTFEYNPLFNLMQEPFYQETPVYITLEQEHINIISHYFEDDNLLEDLEIRGFTLYFTIDYQLAKYVQVGDKFHIRNLYHSPKWLIEKSEFFDEIMFSSYFVNSYVTVKERIFGESFMIYTELKLAIPQQDYHP